MLSVKGKVQVRLYQRPDCERWETAAGSQMNGPVVWAFIEREGAKWRLQMHWRDGRSHRSRYVGHGDELAGPFVQDTPGLGNDLSLGGLTVSLEKAVEPPAVEAIAHGRIPICLSCPHFLRKLSPVVVACGANAGPCEGCGNTVSLLGSCPEGRW